VMYIGKQASFTDIRVGELREKLMHFGLSKLMSSSIIVLVNETHVPWSNG
jgi:hypothetical protein